MLVNPRNGLMSWVDCAVMFFFGGLLETERMIVSTCFNGFS